MIWNLIENFSGKETGEYLNLVLREIVKIVLTIGCLTSQLVNKHLWRT